MDAAPLISVLMAVYNENIDEVSKSIESIINQSYSNIEFIIVLDNPENDMLNERIEEYAKKDDRILIIRNENNIGLALSLNKAFEKSFGQYIARMDADDISAINRLEDEWKFLISNNFDMIFSSRINIDENDKMISKQELPSYTCVQVARILPWDCIITHPSILIKREVFQSLTGYRRFEVSQDYDLWLRMCTEGYKIGFLNKPLIYYRIRRTSLSVQKEYMQFETARYIRKLFTERKKKHIDSYSYSNYIEYLEKKQVYDKDVNSSFSEISKCFFDGISHIKSMQCRGLIEILSCFKKPRWVMYFIYRIIGTKLVRLTLAK